MASIFEAIRNFFHFIASVANLIFHVGLKLARILLLIMDYLSQVFSMVPWWMFLIIGILILVCILYKILGREGNA